MATLSFAQLVRRSFPALVFALASGVANAQTATNTCGYDPGNEYSVSVGTACNAQSFNKPAAFTADLIATGCNAGNNGDSWGWFTAVNTLTTITFDPSSSHRPIMHVYTGACGSLAQLSCVNSGANGSNAVLDLTTVIGQNYMIRIQRHTSDAVMNGTLCIYSPKPTDACSLASVNEYAVSTECVAQPFQKPTAFTASMNPGGCSSGNFDDAWGWFTATASTTIITFDPSASHRPVLHVFSGSCASLTQVACHDGGSNGSNADLSFSTTAGTRYFFRIQRQGTNDEMNGTICIWTPTTSNTCGFDAGNMFSVSVGCDFQTFHKPEAFSAAMNPGGCSSGNNDDAWGWFTAISTNTVITFDPDASFRPVLHVFSGSCGSLVQLACNDAGSNGANAEVAVVTVVGQTYAFRVQRQGSNAAMDGRVCIWSPNTTDVCSYSPQNEFNVTATCSFQSFEFPTAYRSSTNPGTCSSGAFDDAWGWFTAASTTTIITFDPDLSYRPIIHVFSGACGSLVALGCVNSGAAGVNAEIAVNTVIGQNYIFRIQQHALSQGMNGRVCFRIPPPFDACMQSTALPVLQNCFLQNFSNALASRSPDLPVPTCGGTISDATMKDVWFHFVAPASGVVIVETTAGTINNVVMQLYSGSCNALVLEECNDTGMGNNMPKIDRRCNPLVPNATYRLRVWGRSGLQGTFNICVRGFDPYIGPQEDCVGNNAVCNDQVIRNATDWRGCTQDLGTSNRGCLSSNERQGTWYSFSPQATGTLGMLITPVDMNGNPANVDYDFALWGPMNAITCPPQGAPLRCTYAYPPSAGTWLTGMAAGNTDVSEAASGTGVNGFVAPLTIVAADIGRTYVLYVDNFTANGQNFNLDWTLSNNGILNCVVLPVELVHLEATAKPRSIDVSWTTQTEHGSSHFVVERSGDGETFQTIGAVEAGGHSQRNIDYLFVDERPINGWNHYRLTKVDFDGTSEKTEIVTAIFRSTMQSLLLFPNPATDLVQMDLSEVRESIAMVLIMDASGRIVAQRSASDLDQSGHISLYVQAIDAGSYMVSVLDVNGLPLANGRFVKQ